VEISDVFFARFPAAAIAALPQLPPSCRRRRRRLAEGKLPPPPRFRLGTCHAAAKLPPPSCRCHQTLCGIASWHRVTSKECGTNEIIFVMWRFLMVSLLVFLPLPLLRCRNCRRAAAAAAA
jgi:hypothetical protein